MSVILILILASLAVAVAFLAGFIWAVKAGQFEDTCTPAMRILSEDEAAKQNIAEPGEQQGGLERPHAIGLPGPKGLSRPQADAPASGV
jgi:cbb3-type cytochrome oxidase maturation protein